MYIFLTYHVLSDTCDIELYESLDAAKEEVDKRTEAQTNISRGIVVEDYGDKYSVPVPMEFSMHFWPVGNVVYGTCVEDDATGKLPGITEENKTRTYRMVIEKPVHNERK